MTQSKVRRAIPCRRPDTALMIRDAVPDAVPLPGHTGRTHQDESGRQFLDRRGPPGGLAAYAIVAAPGSARLGFPSAAAHPPWSRRETLKAATSAITTDTLSRPPLAMAPSINVSTI